MKLTTITLYAALLAALSVTGITPASAHSERGEKRPQTYAEASIPWTEAEFGREKYFRHPPGNVRAEDMASLFGNTVVVVDAGRKYSSVGATKHALKVVFIGRNGRYINCGYDKDFQYYAAERVWAATKRQHGKSQWHLLHPAINDNKRPGLSPLYDGKTGQIVFYRNRKTWHTRNPGHLQERLPRAVWTLCPDFPSAEELGVGVNEAQTAITYDKLIAQDPGRRVLRPDLITIDPTEPAQ